MNLKNKVFLFPVLGFFLINTLVSCSRLRESEELAEQTQERKGGQTDSKDGDEKPENGVKNDKTPQLGSDSTPDRSSKIPSEPGALEVSRVRSISYLTCPENYLGVPGISSYASEDFCVAAYEMKIMGIDDGNTPYKPEYIAESRPSGTPWVSIDRSSAESECQALGEGYDLISNNEWQTLARNLEIISDNWTSKNVGREMMYVGNSDCVPGTALAVVNREDHFDLTMNNHYQNLKMGKGQRRTLFLPSGEAIWDLSGNVGEWVKGELNSSKYYYYDQYDRAAEIARFTEWGDAKGASVNIMQAKQRLFGPQSVYMDGRSSNQYYGLGYADFEVNLGSIVRGGWSCFNKPAGVFSVSLYHQPSAPAGGYGYIGFRCVKHIESKKIEASSSQTSTK